MMGFIEAPSPGPGTWSVLTNVSYDSSYYQPQTPSATLTDTLHI